MDGMTEGRPVADELLRVMVDRPGKLNPRAARKLPVNESRCPSRHLLAAVVQTAHGPWLYWHDNSGVGAGWQCAWRADLDSPIVRAWCNCRDVWLVDTVMPDKPPTLAIS
jgi:hypothetical protein